MTKKIVKERIGMMSSENEEVDPGRLEMLKEAGRKRSLRGRRGELIEGKRSISSNK